MNNYNTDSQESLKKINGKVRLNGKYVAGIVTPPSNREIQPKETSNHETSSERSKQGSKGISSDAKANMDVALDEMVKKYGYKLLFLVITFNKVKWDTKRKFARNPDKVINAIKYVLDKLGIPYILNTGVQKPLSYDAEMPLYDINIVLPIEGVDIDKLLRAIALKLRDIENDSRITESIGTWYCEPITNNSRNFEKFKIYMIEQSEYHAIFKTITDEWGMKLKKQLTLN